MSQLSTFYPAPITAADLGLGPASNATFGSIQNTPIGSTTPNSGAFTTLTAQGDGTNALVATFGAADGINNEIQIWGNGAGRNHRIIGSTSAGIAFGLGTAQPTMVVNAGTPQGFRMFSAAALQWTSHGSNASSGTVDCAIFRDAADTVAQRRDTNPQTFRIYNTFTDASNYERGFMRWSSNNFEIGTEGAGTGTQNRQIHLKPGSNTTTNVIITSGQIIMQTANLNMGNGNNIISGSATGCKIGSATNQKFAFWNATPVGQPAAIANATDAASTQDRLNDLLATMRTLGLIAT